MGQRLSPTKLRLLSKLSRITPTEPKLRQSLEELHVRVAGDRPEDQHPRLSVLQGGRNVVRESGWVRPNLANRS